MQRGRAPVPARPARGSARSPGFGGAADPRAEPRLGLLFAQGTGTVAGAALPWAGVDFFVCSVLAPALRSRSFLLHRRCRPCLAPQQSAGLQRVRASIRSRLLLPGAGDRGSESASPGGPHPRFPRGTAVRGETRGSGTAVGPPRGVDWSLGTGGLSGNAPRSHQPAGTSKQLNPPPPPPPPPPTRDPQLSNAEGRTTKRPRSSAPPKKTENVKESEPPANPTSSPQTARRGEPASSQWVVGLPGAPLALHHRPLVPNSFEFNQIPLLTTGSCEVSPPSPIILKQKESRCR